jgi:hypothetical protein
MPLVEVDDGELTTTRAAKALLDKFAADPAIRPQMLGWVKKLNPQASIPELDAAEPIKNEIAKFREEVTPVLDEIKTERAARAATAEWEGKVNEERKKLRAAGWDDEGIGQIEAKMQEEGITSYKAAAALVEKELADAQKNTTTTSDYGRGWDIPSAPEGGEEDHKLLMTGTGGRAFGAERWANKEVKKFLGEIRSAGRR